MWNHPSSAKVMPRRCPPCRGQGKRADGMMKFLVITMEDCVEADGRPGQIIREACNGGTEVY